MVEKFTNELLAYDKIKIYQSNNLQNFSLDSLLLADFVSITPKVKEILDLCSGNGVISLYLTLRTKANILNVELQEESHYLAEESVKLNNFDKINCVNDDLIGIHKKIGINKFDRITCNPPFFKYDEGSNINDTQKLSIARHEITVKLEDIIVESTKLLKNGGNLSLVHRPDRLTDIIFLMRKHGIEPKRLKFVHPKKGKDANHILIEGKKNSKQGGLIVEKPLVVYNEDNTYTSQINEIYYKKEEF